MNCTKISKIFVEITKVSNICMKVSNICKEKNEAIVYYVIVKTNFRPDFSQFEQNYNQKNQQFKQTRRKNYEEISCRYALFLHVGRCYDSMFKDR